MRKFIGLTIALLFAVTATAQKSDPRTISVDGQAEVRIVPDELIIMLGVETVDPQLRAANAANDAAVSRALAVIRKHNVTDEDIQTDYLRVEPRYKSRNEEEGKLLHHVVRRDITIRLRDLRNYEPLMAALLEGGVNRIHGLDFRTTELRKHRDRARLMALTAAREKAEALAAHAGGKAGKAISISEGSCGGWTMRSRSNSFTIDGQSNNDVGGAFAAGMITITEGVSVTYELQ